MPLSVFLLYFCRFYYSHYFFFQQAYCLCFINLSKLPILPYWWHRLCCRIISKWTLAYQYFSFQTIYHLIYEHFNLSRSKFKDLPQRSVRLSIVLIAIYHICIYLFILVAVIVIIANKIISSTIAFRS